MITHLSEINQNSFLEPTAYLDNKKAHFLFYIFINQLLDNKKDFKYKITLSRLYNIIIEIETKNDNIIENLKEHFNFENEIKIVVSENSYKCLLNVFNENGFDYLLPSLSLIAMNLNTDIENTI